MLVESGRVDEDDRQAGAADLLDLGVVLAQAQGHEAVDAGQTSGARQRAVQRRDEQQAVTGFLGDAGHSLAEHAEERIGERRDQGLRGQDAEGAGVALGEHPGNRVGPVAERVRDRADPGRRLGAQPIGVVEGDRDGRLGHAGLSCDIADAYATGTLMIHVPPLVVARACYDRGQGWAAAAVRSLLVEPVH